MKIVLFICLTIYYPLVQASEVLESARELIIQGDRTKALNLLQNEILITKKTKDKEKLSKELNKLSEIFLSEKSQKLYQQALTLFYVRGSQYKNKLAEAEKIEPNNLKILGSKLWSNLVEKKCSSAQDVMGQIRKINASYGELKAFDFYLSVCQNKPKYDCESLVYETSRSDRQKLLNLLQCKAKQSELGKIKKYCELLKIDMPKLPELSLICSEEASVVKNYETSCKSFKVAETELVNVYPFICDKEISSKLFKN